MTHFLFYRDVVKSFTGNRYVAFTDNPNTLVKFGQTYYSLMAYVDILIDVNIVTYTHRKL